VSDSRSGDADSTRDSIEQLRDHIRQFVRERDWEQFHAPKNLAVSVAVEAAELLELFQWQDEDASRTLTAEQRTHMAQEIGDVLIYLIQLADQYGLDPIQCAWDKMKLNGAHYPVDQARGSAQKYTAYESDADHNSGDD
jgi:NTP pyrophosphatase (non-canonical NTP hydrolase)